MAIPQSLMRPALPSAVNREGAVYSPLTLTCLFLRFSAGDRPSAFALKRRDLHTWPHGGQRRVFLPLPLHPLTEDVKIAHGGTRSATGAHLRSTRQRWRRGMDGVRGSAPASRRTAYSRTLCLPPSERWDWRFSHGFRVQTGPFSASGGVLNC